jgi:hypothetical protein
MKTFKFLKRTVLMMIIVMACSTAFAGVSCHRYFYNNRPRTTVVVRKHVVNRPVVNRPRVVVTKRVVNRHCGTRATVVVNKHKRVVYRR